MLLRIMLHRMKAFLALPLLFCVAPAWADVTVYAAASLTNALKDISTAYQASNGVAIKNSFAASSTLAKQIEAGAPAQIFASADRKWMDYLQARKQIERASRVNLLGNTLVLIAPAAEPRTVTMAAGQAPRFEGRLCMGEPGSVPAGIYGKEALTKLGWWEALKGRVVGTDDVRTALAFVERAECPLGIVYETDAKVSNKVMVAGVFPAGSHEPVVYPFALLPGATAEARAFFRYLQGAEARAVFVRYGFSQPTP
jgi:molybdate transport system substrate-binding protein